MDKSNQQSAISIQPNDDPYRDQELLVRVREAYGRELERASLEPTTSADDTTLIRAALPRLLQLAERIHVLELDARRYWRLRVLGCAPAGSDELQQSLVMRFSNLDEFIEHDIKINPSRGEAQFTEETHHGITFQNPPLSEAEIEQARRLKTAKYGAATHLKISFDIGGVISKYPEVFKPLIQTLLRAGCQVFLLTDIPMDKAKEMLFENGFAEQFSGITVLAGDYATHGELNKAHLIREHGIQIHIDDFAGYCANNDCVSLFVWPNPYRPYYADNWKTDESEGAFGSFGRVKCKQSLPPAPQLAELAQRDTYIKNLEAAVLIHERLVRKLQATSNTFAYHREYLDSLAIIGKISTAGMEASKVFTGANLQAELATPPGELRCPTTRSEDSHDSIGEE